MIQMVAVQKPSILPEPEIDVAIRDVLARPRLMREICQICDVINHAS